MSELITAQRDHLRDPIDQGRWPEAYLYVG